MKFFFVALAACVPELTPATGPNTSYPCGVEGVSCGNHMCCSQSEVCGGTPGCPAGMCCFVGDETGARRPEPQRPEK